MSVAAIVLFLLTGFIAVRLVWPNGLRFCRHDVLRVSFGAGVGLALASIVTFKAAAVFHGSRGFVIGADAALFVIAASWYALWRRNTGCVFCRLPATPGSQLLWLAVAIAVLVAAGTFAIYADLNPHGEWDAWAIWNNHARFLASGAEWSKMFSGPLVWTNQDYPLLVPGAVANAWIVSGSQSEAAPIAIAAVFVFASAGLLFGAMDLLRGQMQAMVAVVVLFGAPALARMGSSQYADVPLAFFYLAAAVMIALASLLNSDRSAYCMAGFAASCAAWTKNEGIVFLGVAFAAVVFALWRSSKLANDKGRLMWMAAGALPVTLVLTWFKIAYSPGNYLFKDQQPLSQRIGDVSRYMAVLVEFGKQLFTFGGWVLPPVLIAAAYLWLMGRSKRDDVGRHAVLAALVLMTIAYAGVYLITTKDLDWQIETSLPRIFMHLWPMAVVGLLLYANPPRSSAAPEQVSERVTVRKHKK
jgi:hypothetical protein